MIDHPSAFVWRAPLRPLLAAWASQSHLGYIDDDAGLRTVCPRCRHVDCNGPTLVVLTAAVMRCHRCRWFGNRAAIERRVLERPDLLDALIDELAVPS